MIAVGAVETDGVVAVGEDAHGEDDREEIADYLLPAVGADDYWNEADLASHQ